MTTPLNFEKEFVPQWAKSVVWYQILPERFRNGDCSNDPTPEDIAGADPQDPPSHWQIHPWGSDWYELQPYEIKNGEQELWKHLLRRRYGGDLQGIIDKFDYLQELGISGIYLNPVFQAPSHHKYDSATFHHIDPTFGPDPKTDREHMRNENPADPCTWVWTSADELALQMIEQAHRKNIKIIFDGVFNHMGINSFAFRDAIRNGYSSPYRDWFTFYSKPHNKRAKPAYKCWAGVKSLPELHQDRNGLVSGPQKYIFAATERWMNPKNKGIDYGIDGWRLDVAFCINHVFWKKWRKHVKHINPDAFLTAELVDEAKSLKSYFHGDEFDGEMNYNFAFACSEFFFQPPPLRISVTRFDKKLEHLRRVYPQGVAFVTQNCFNSHDTNRLSSHILNRGIGQYRKWTQYFHLSKAAQNHHYNTGKPGTKEKQLQKLFVIFQMTYVGAPMIFYGDEAGMWGANDPDCRKPMLWPDIDYAPERFNADGSTHDPDPVKIDYDLLAHYKKMISIRNQNVALQMGDFTTLSADDGRQVYIFLRLYDKNAVLVALNNSEQEQKVENPLQKYKWKDVLNLKKDHTSTHLHLPSRWGAVLVKTTT